MKTILFFGILLLFFCCAHKKIKNDNNVIRNYEGTIGTLKIKANLTFSGNSFGGTYFYTKIGRDILVNGKLDGQHFKMEEPYGIFDGTISDNFESIKGIWKSKKNKGRQFSFEFKQIFSCAFLEHTSNVNFYQDKKLKETFSCNEIKFTDTLEKPYLREINKILVYDKNMHVGTKDTIENKGPDSLESFGWPFDINSFHMIEYMDNNLISIGENNGGYEGGAHPNSSVIFASYYISRGFKKGGKLKQIRLGGIFVKNYMPVLLKIAEKEFRKEKNIPEKSSLTDSGYFQEGVFTLNDNFYLTASGISFFYNSYEIASYAQGPSDIFIPYSDLKYIIDPKGPLAVYMDFK